MVVHPADRSIVTWAVEQGYPHEYVREYGLPDPSLRIRLGMSSAFFSAGRLIHWRADVNGQYLDQLMYELSCLFGFCARIQAYPKQHVFLDPSELMALQRPLSEAG